METIGIEYQQQMVFLINVCATAHNVRDRAVDSVFVNRLNVAQFISTDIRQLRVCSIAPYVLISHLNSLWLWHSGTHTLIRRLLDIIVNLNHGISHIFLCHAYKHILSIRLQ